TVTELNTESETPILMRRLLEVTVNRLGTLHIEGVNDNVDQEKESNALEQNYLSMQPSKMNENDQMDTVDDNIEIY
ncbi:hypothetical protein HHI36_016769, partial [Cryptolaemus montrouzieri]